MIRAAVIALILLSVPASAVAEFNAGVIGSDSPLWKLDLALERIHERIQLNQDARVNLQLRHADERIGEMMQAENKDQVMGEYTSLMSRIQSTEQLRYDTTASIESHMYEHTKRLGNSEYAEAESASKQLHQHAQTAQSEHISSEQTRWSNLISGYNVPDTPVSIEETFGLDLSSVQSFVPAGISIITITTSDGAVLSKYTVRNGDRLQISRNAATRYDNSYTLTVCEVEQYVNQYGKVIGLED